MDTYLQSAMTKRILHYRCWMLLKRGMGNEGFDVHYVEMPHLSYIHVDGIMQV